MTTLDELRDSIKPIVAKALSDDIDKTDLAASPEAAEKVIGATIVARGSLLVCGRPWVDEVFAQLDESVHIDWYIVDGQTVEDGDVVCKLIGPARAFLVGESSALNFLTTLSSSTKSENDRLAEFSMNLNIDQSTTT